MKILPTLLLLSCTLPGLGQDRAPYGANDLDERIDAFAEEVRQAMRSTHEGSSIEGPCSEFNWISAKARALAAEVRAERDRLPNPAVGLAYTSAMAASLQPTDPQAAGLLSWYGTHQYVNAKATHARWFPVERLEDISYFASEADKARTTRRMTRMQERVLRSADEL